MKINFGCIVVLVILLAVILVLIVPWLNAQNVQAGYPTPAPPPKPTVTLAPPPTGMPPVIVPPASPPNPKDRNCRKGCKDEPRISNSTATPLPIIRNVPQGKPRVYLPLVIQKLTGGTGNPYPYPAP